MGCRLVAGCDRNHWPDVVRLCKKHIDPEFLKITKRTWIIIGAIFVSTSIISFDVGGLHGIQILYIATTEFLILTFLENVLQFGLIGTYILKTKSEKAQKYFVIYCLSNICFFSFEIHFQPRRFGFCCGSHILWDTFKKSKIICSFFGSCFVGCIFDDDKVLLMNYEGRENWRNRIIQVKRGNCFV